MTWNWVDSRADLYDFLAQVIVCAPNDFIEVDYLSREDQLDLETAFAELYRGMKYVAETIKDPAQLKVLRGLLDQSLMAYRGGDAAKGARLLQDFERLAFN